jgi:glycosyltransferase involved in cell wall biosynthesis
MTLHETLLELQRRGHEVTVYRRASRPYEFEGVPVREAAVSVSGRIAQSHDLVIAQLDGAKQASTAFHNRLPIVHLVHVYGQLRDERITERDADLVVMNSESMARQIDWKGRQIVIPPVVDHDRYRTRPGNRITLINLNNNKGGDLFWKIAKAMPTHEFLAVRGAYQQQIIPRHIPSNVKLMDHTSTPRDIYSQTRVLLMPSLLETWGRTAIEAGVSGIPTIAHRSPGLEEALGIAGRFADRDNLSEWVDAIRALDDPIEYERASALSLSRVSDLADARHMDILEAELESIVDGFKKMPGNR